MSENQELLMEQARYVRKIIEARGFHARIETINAVEAWMGTLPGHPYPNVRRPLIHTLNLADLLPLSGIWPGLTENPCSFYPAGSPPLMQTVTTGATPFRLNLHDGDVGHTLIFGPTGAGKSTLLAMILAQFRRYQSRPRPGGSTVPASVTAFDKGRSLYTLCKALGGQHYDIGSDDGDDLALCPLADIDIASDALWAEEWIAACFELQTGVAPTPEQKNEIHRAITLMSHAPKTGRSLSDFISTVQDGAIRSALNHYTVTGSMGHLLDGYEDPLKKSSFVVYEIDELMALGEKNAIPVLLYLFRRFEQSLDGQPAILSLDEAWVMLAHSVFRQKLRQWLKELRKKNCAVLIATQSLSDAIGSGLIDTLLEQCPTKIFLPNKEAKSTGTAEHPGPAVYYKIFGLNDNEIDLLSIAEYKRDYYYKSPMGRRPFRLGLGPLALSFVGVSDKDTIREVKACEAAHGEDWPIHWLTGNGVDYAKYTR
jgi:type IV secretion system protein VirB4